MKIGIFSNMNTCKTIRIVNIYVYIYSTYTYTFTYVYMQTHAYFHMYIYAYRFTHRTVYTNIRVHTQLPLPQTCSLSHTL